MLRALIVTAGLWLFCAPACLAADIEILRGQFAFDWHSASDKVHCVAVDDNLLGKFKSPAFECNLEPATNTASDEPARVCSEKAGDAEYLIFESQKSCELERTTQLSNGD